MNVAPAIIRTDSNVFQKYLIPAESKTVRYAMQKASQLAESNYFLLAHLGSVSLAIVAIAISFFNATSYFLQIPFKILLNIVSCHPLSIFSGFFTDLTNIARSLVFVSLGVTFVTAGLIFPSAIFSHFAPDYRSPAKSQLQRENILLKQKIEQLEKEKKKANAAILAANTLIQELKEKNFSAKKL